MLKRDCSLLITDLDNTLWDWVEIWRASFDALLRQTVRISGLSAETLESEIKLVHRKHQTSEYAFLLEELPSLLRLHAGKDIRLVYADAFNARRAARNAACQLYPGVRETIEFAHRSGAKIVGYTESSSFYTSERLLRTGLDDVIDVLYSAADHDLPTGLTQAQIRRHPESHYTHRLTLHRHTPSGVMKPNATVLKSIIDAMAGDARSTVYIGDSLLKDVAMAQEAGITDVWARCGYSPTAPGYEQLKRVTHWTPMAVEVEKATTTKTVPPSFVIDRFDELVDHFRFCPSV